MSTAPVVAKRATHEGRSVLDGKSFVRFTLGFIAGGAGIDGTVVGLAALGYEAALDVIAAEDRGSVAFKRRQGESYANQAADMMLTLLGVYVGQYAKERWESEELKRRSQAQGLVPSTVRVQPWLTRVLAY